MNAYIEVIYSNTWGKEVLYLGLIETSPITVYLINDTHFQEI